jgi:hypothetical protein
MLVQSSLCVSLDKSYAPQIYCTSQNSTMSSSYIPPEYNIETQHDGTGHLAVKNSFIRRFLTRLALRTTAKFYSQDGLCVPISKHKIVKTGR